MLGRSSNFAFATRNPHSELWHRVRLIRGGPGSRTDFFLGAKRLWARFLAARDRFLHELLAD
jgi:hypothetical protein